MPSNDCSGIDNDWNACTTNTWQNSIIKFSHVLQIISSNCLKIELIQGTQSSSIAVRWLALARVPHDLSKMTIHCTSFISDVLHCKHTTRFSAQMCHSPMLIMQLKSHRLLSMWYYHGLAAVCETKIDISHDLPLHFVPFRSLFFTQLANRSNWQIRTDTLIVFMFTALFTYSIQRIGECVCVFL